MHAIRAVVSFGGPQTNLLGPSLPGGLGGVEYPPVKEGTSEKGKFLKITY